MHWNGCRDGWNPTDPAGRHIVTTAEALTVLEDTTAIEESRPNRRDHRSEEQP